MRIAAKAALVAVLALPSIPLALAGRAPAATSIGGPPLHEFVFDTGVDPPTGVVEGPDGQIWFASDSQALTRIDQNTGKLTTLPLPGIYPESLIVGPDKNFWFTDGPNNSLGKATLAGVTSEYDIGGLGFAMTVGLDGSIWVGYNGPIHKFTTAGTDTSYPFTGWVRGMTAGPDGNIWFTDLQTNSVGKIDTAGVITEYPLPVQASGPIGIATGSDGALWVTELNNYRNGRIARVTTSGVVTEFPLPQQDIPSEHPAIVVGPDGNVWFACGIGIGWVTPSGQVTELATKVAPIRAVTLARDGKIWFVGGGGGGLSSVEVGWVQPAGSGRRVDGVVEVPDPGQLDLSARALATSFGFAGLMLLLALVASDLLNATLDANWETVRRWPVIRTVDRAAHRSAEPPMGLRPRDIWATPVGYGLFLAASSALVVLWHPSVQRVGEALFGVIVGSLLRAACTLGSARRRFGEQHHGYVHARPASLAIGAATLGASRAVGLGSPVIFGLLAGVAFTPELPRARAGAVTALASGAFTSVAVGGWFVRWGLRSWVAHPSTAVRVVENGLSILLLSAVWSLALGMVPLKYFPGHTVRAWKPWVWAVIWLTGLAFALHVLLSDYGVANARGNDHWKLLMVEAVIVTFAFALWASFAFRKPARPRVNGEDETTAIATTNAPQPEPELP